MAYELYQSRYKGYEIDNLLDDVGDLNTDVAALKTEYDANKVKMSDGTILPMYLVNTYATKTELSAKADSTQVAADIATATTDMATNTGVASAIATATTDMATNTGVASAIATATTDMATNTGVASAIATATSDMATNTGVASAIATATTDMATNTSVASDIATATADMATNTSVASDIATATTDMATNASVAAAIAAAAYTLPEATTSTLGGVKPDGTTITVDSDGTIHGASAIAKLDDIGDVNASSPSDGQVLGYDSSTDTWIPTNAGGGSGGHTIIDSDNTSMTARTGLQFGSDLETSDDSTNNKTVVSPHELTNEEVAEILGVLPINPSSAYMPNTGFTPVGTIIAVMGNEAPQHYLKCDGMIYNISQYPVLAKYFKDQFGSENYFGGNGTTTFAVPDLRGEFLRGTGTNSHTDDGTGNGDGAAVGTHQNATVLPNVYSNTSSKKLRACGKPDGSNNMGAANADKYITGADFAGMQYVDTAAGTTAALASAATGKYTARPTNTSVLYCIAVQNIYIDAHYDYSTDEKVVGTWIDGKPIYQKTIDFNSITYTDANKRRTFTLGTIDDVDMLVDVKGSYSVADNNYLAGVTFVASDPVQPQYSIYGVVNSSTHKVTTYFASALVQALTSVKGYVTVQYTKTTD